MRPFRSKFSQLAKLAPVGRMQIQFHEVTLELRSKIPARPGPGAAYMPHAPVAVGDSAVPSPR